MLGSSVTARVRWVGELTVQQRNITPTPTKTGESTHIHWAGCPIQPEPSFPRTSASSAQKYVFPCRPLRNGCADERVLFILDSPSVFVL